VPFINCNVDRFNNRSATVVKMGELIGEFDDIFEVMEGCITTSLIKVGHKGRSIVRGEDGAITADLD
tara:strand:+ start:9663 stop:9863 length:201 start_codon:yes stop_codon:yes gene_type:complete